MISIITGILLIAFSVIAGLPEAMHGFGWGDEIVHFLKGAAPVAAVFAGIITILIGFADLKDRREAKLGEEEARRAEEESKKQG